MAGFSTLKGSTQESYSNAQNYWNEFLRESNDLPVLTCDNLPDIMQAFAVYLVTKAKKSNGDSLMQKSALQYFSNMKNQLKKSKEFKDCSAWSNEEWYTILYNEISKEIAYRAIQLGLPITEKSRPIGRAMLLLICKELLKENSSYSVEAWVTILTTFLANGRTGEIAKTIWNDNTYYNIEHESLFMDWSQSKTSKVKQMTFFPDKEHPEMDFYLSLATYFAIGGFQRFNAEKKWIFPFIADLKQPNRKINEYLAKLRPRIHALTEEYQGTALRIGATNHLANHPDITIEQLIVFGGWDMSSFSAAFHYILQLEEPIIKCARALSGWDPKFPVYPPRLVLSDILASDKEKISFDNMKKSMFSDILMIMKKEDYAFVDHLMASVLMHMEYMNKNYPKNVLYEKLNEKSIEFKIPIAELKKIGSLIRDDYQKRNSRIDTSNDLTNRIIQLLSDKLDDVSKSVKKMEESQATLFSSRLSLESALIQECSVPLTPAKRSHNVINPELGSNSQSSVESVIEPSSKKKML
jgi:hypothetical protein